jgi:hypothetical protein
MTEFRACVLERSSGMNGVALLAPGSPPGRESGYSPSPKLQRAQAPSKRKIYLG